MTRESFAGHIQNDQRRIALAQGGGCLSQERLPAGRFLSPSPVPGPPHLQQYRCGEMTFLIYSPSPCLSTASAQRKENPVTGSTCSSLCWEQEAQGTRPPPTCLPPGKAIREGDAGSWLHIGLRPPDL